jgi:hypothetical protein
MAKYFVMDNENNPSWNPDDEKAESFASQSAAIKRAVDLAESIPGEPVYVCKAVEIVTCPVGPAVSEAVA